MQGMPDVSLLLSNGKEYAQIGRVDAVSGIVDASTGAVSLRAVFPNKEHLLRNGGTGTVVISTIKENVIVIPQTATFELQNKVFVYRVIDGKTAQTEIRVAPLDDGTTYIVEEGLTEGDVIIAEGAGLLKEGVEVKSPLSAPPLGEYPKGKIGKGKNTPPRGSREGAYDR